MSHVAHMENSFFQYTVVHCCLLTLSRIFHSYEVVNNSDKRLKIWTDAKRFYSLSSEVSLACYTFYDMRPFYAQDT